LWFLSHPSVKRSASHHWAGPLLGALGLKLGVIPDEALAKVRNTSDCCVRP
jgi:hypothetical protein